MSQIDTLTDEQIEYARKSLEAARVHIQGAKEGCEREVADYDAASWSGHLLWAEKLVTNALSVFETPSVLRAISDFERGRVDL